MTYEEAIKVAIEWAEGKRSHLNTYMMAESDVAHRPQTLAAVAQADAAEVVAWAAIAQALATRRSA